MNPIDHSKLKDYSIDDILSAASLLARARPKDERLKREVKLGLQALQHHLAARSAVELADHLIQGVVDEYADTEAA